ncbi:hypothetical protein HDU79_009003 [Rhizoclosmatium sp. JEL0117]|nr:hypothetical protein HDU79_009003 [Rhizoclosmatium sp. JEL0117]
MATIPVAPFFDSPVAESSARLSTTSSSSSKSQLKFDDAAAHFLRDVAKFKANKSSKTVNPQSRIDAGVFRVVNLSHELEPLRSIDQGCERCSGFGSGLRLK